MTRYGFAWLVLSVVLAGCGWLSSGAHPAKRPEGATAPPAVKTVSVGAAAYQGSHNLDKWLTAAKEHPTSEAAQLQAGVAAFQNGKPNLAILYYEKAGKLDPASPVPPNNIGNVYRNTGHNLGQAVYYYQSAIKLDPQYDVAWYNLAYTYAEMGRKSEAESTAKRALATLAPKVDPDASAFEEMAKTGQ